MTRREVLRVLACVLALAVALSAVPTVVVPVAFAADTTISLDDYATSVREAREAVDAAADKQLTDRQATDLATRVNSLVPLSVEVETATGVVTANHTVVRGLVARLDAVDTATERTQAIDDLQAQLASLESAIGEPTRDAVPEDSEALDELLGAQPAQAQSPFQELLARLIDRIARAIQEWWTSMGASPGARSTLTTATIVVIVALGLLLAFLVVRVVIRWRAGMQRDDQGSLPVLGQDAVVVAARDLPTDPLAYADERAAAGDMREAIRALFGGAARALQEAGYIVEARTRTNHELLLEVRPRSERVHAPLEALCGEFERVWYGHRDFTAHEYARGRERYLHVLAGLSKQDGEDQ